jgi:hypothetical protein
VADGFVGPLAAVDLDHQVALDNAEDIDTAEVDPVVDFVNFAVDHFQVNKVLGPDSGFERQMAADKEIVPSMNLPLSEIKI